jgi:hypothetical protein
MQTVSEAEDKAFNLWIQDAPHLGIVEANQSQRLRKYTLTVVT